MQRCQWWRRKVETGTRRSSYASRRVAGRPSLFMLYTPGPAEAERRWAPPQSSRPSLVPLSKEASKVCCDPAPRPYRPLRPLSFLRAPFSVCCLPIPPSLERPTRSPTPDVGVGDGGKGRSVYEDGA